MKSSNIFWGTFLTSLGVFFLLDNLDIATVAIHKIWIYWPILLIIWGVSILKIPTVLKLIMAGISGLFLAIVIMSLINYNWNENLNWNIRINDDGISIGDTLNEVDDYDIQKNNYPMQQNYKIANLNFDGGAGEFNISGTCKDLFLISSGAASTTVNTNAIDSIIDVDFDFSGKSLNLHKNSRFAKINLNPDLIWNFNIDAGAAKFDLDLSQYQVNNVSIEAGAIDLRLKLGSLYKDTKVDISTGASNLKIEIPTNSGCIINTDVSLSDKNFNGFNKIKAGQYATGDYQKASNLIQINIDGALSSISVSRY